MKKTLAIVAGLGLASSAFSQGIIYTNVIHSLIPLDVTTTNSSPPTNTYIGADALLIGQQFSFLSNSTGKIFPTNYYNQPYLQSRTSLIATFNYTLSNGLPFVLITTVTAQ